MIIFVSGAAGFIGFHLCKKLLEEGFKVIGFDNLNSYYDRNLKINRLKELNKINSENSELFEFIKGDLSDKNQLKEIFERNLKLKKPIKIVINLAAQAGVRYSIENPSAYIQSNIVGFSSYRRI